jgi:hypothetical protein
MKAASILFVALLVSQASAFGVVSSPREHKNHASSATALHMDAASVLQGFDMSSVSNQMMAGFAALVGLVGAAATQVGKKSTSDGAATSSSKVVAVPEEVVVDISIPYDSAARLAFAATGLTESKFAEFKPLYEAKTVADVTAKKMARDLQSMKDVAAEKTKALEALSLV